jgi:type I restriction enzyme S subunit
VDERSRTGAEELLSVSHLTGVTPRSQKNVTMFKAANYVGHKICHPGDIVVNTLWAWMAALGTARHTGLVSPAYGIYRPHNADSFNLAYLDYLLRTSAYVTEYIGRSTGIRASRLRLYPNQFLDITLIQPPRHEQDQIVRFLGWKVSQINRLINAKHKQIALLQEQKWVMTNAVVMQGGKGSARRLKTLVRDVAEKSSPIGQFYVGMENIISWIATYIETSTIVDGDCKHFSSGDLLFGKLRPYLAKVYLPQKDGVCSGEFLVLRGFEGDMDYLKYSLLSYDFIMKVNSSTYGAKMPRANWSFIGNCEISVPSLVEQKSIVAYLDEQYAKIDKLTAKLNDEIALFTEYRTRLVSDVVTGKTDVRGVVMPDYDMTDEDSNSQEILVSSEEDEKMEDEA